MAEIPRKKIGIEYLPRAKRDNVYGRGHLWFKNAWSAMEKLHESQSQTSTPPTMDPEHSAFLSGLRSSMLEHRRIKQSEISELYKIYRRYSP
ncbi:MAG: hypothetical protein ABH863_03485 [Candidatus Micrarchaeota archaeon]